MLITPPIKEEDRRAAFCVKTPASDKYIGAEVVGKLPNLYFKYIDLEEMHLGADTWKMCIYKKGQLCDKHQSLDEQGQKEHIVFLYAWGDDFSIIEIVHIIGVSCEHVKTVLDERFF